MRIKNYKQYTVVTEEFVFKSLGGVLGKIMSFFQNAFQDAKADFKASFKEDDTSENQVKSIQDAVMKNFNQAIDGAQNKIGTLQTDGDVLGLMDQIVQNLVSLANGFEKELKGTISDKFLKSTSEIAKSIVLGNKEADWVGIVGALDPTSGLLKKDIKFPFSKAKYVEAVNAGKDLKSKQKAASQFLDNMQKAITNELNKGFTGEEMEMFYDKTREQSGGTEGEMNFKNLKELQDKKVKVIYLLKGKKKEDYDPKKKPEEQADVVGVKPIETLDDKNTPTSVIFLDKDGKPNIKKSYKEIIGPVEGGGEDNENAKKAAEQLGKIKNDQEKMGKVAKYAEFIQNDANKDKIDEIDKILGGEAQPAEE